MHDLEEGAKSRLILRPELLSQEEVALHRSSLKQSVFNHCDNSLITDHMFQMFQKSSEHATTLARTVTSPAPPHKLVCSLPFSLPAVGPKPYQLSARYVRNRKPIGMNALQICPKELGRVASSASRNILRPSSEAKGTCWRVFCS